MKALLRLYQGSIKTLSRLYQGSIKALTPRTRRSDDVLLTLSWILVLSMDGGTVLIYPDDSERQIRGSKPLEA
jgi:hypothetical protein